MHVSLRRLQDSDRFIYTIDLDLREQVELARRPDRPHHTAITREDRVPGIVRTDEVARTVRLAAGDLVEKFIAAYEAANEPFPVSAVGREK